MKKFTKNKYAIIVQSYEELPYLVWLINQNNTNIFEEKEFVIFSFGGSDFWQHLNILFKDKKHILVDLSLQSKNNLLNSKKILDRIRYFLYLNFKIKHLILGTDSIIFFTPFCVPHLSKILSLYKSENVYFVPIPVLQLKGFLDKNGNVVPRELSSIFNKLNITIRLLKLRLFFGRNVSLAQLGVGLEPVLSNSILKKFHCLKNFFPISDISKYDQYYLKHNYISDFEFKFGSAQSLVFFDQHYVARKIVINNQYYKLLSDVFSLFYQAGYGCYYKGHPDLPQDQNEKIPKFVFFLPSFIPAEFVSINKVTSFSITSGAIANNLGSDICLSLINLIPFKDLSFKNRAKKILKRKTKVRVFCPKNLNDIKRLIEARQNKEDILTIFNEEIFITPSKSD